MTEWIICSGPDLYRPSVSSTEQLLRQFYDDGHPVFWINPLPFRSPFIGSSSRTSVLRKINDKLRTHFRWLRRDSPNFWVLAPVYLPLFGHRAERVNQWLVHVQVNLCCILLGINIREAVLWISGSFTAEALLDWPFYRKVYEAADLISDLRNASLELKKKLKSRERNLCQKADKVFAASERIAEKLVALCENESKVHLLYHGVDLEHFSAEVEPAEIMKRLRSLNKPIAGYFGSLTDANDKAIFLALAEHGFSVVVIGKVLGDYIALEKNKNIYMLGPVPYSQLPRYARSFDIGLLNWRMDEWILNCFPIKALEYLALGLPVVSCKIPVLMEHFSDVISFVETPEEFVVEARRLVAQDNAEFCDKRREIVKSWSWNRRYAFVREALGL